MQRPRRDDAPVTLAPEIDPASEFEVFFELEHGRLHHAVFMATGSRTDADDRTHEALLHAWERWERVRIMHRPSLFVIRRAMNPLRAVLSGRWVARRRRFRHEPTLEPFEDVRLDDETRGIVLDLSRDQRSSLTLVRSLDLSPGEAGRALGRRAASIRGDVGAAERLVRDRRVASPTSDLDDDDPVLDLLEKVRRACAPDPGAFDRHLAMRARAVRRRRASTVAAVAVVTAIVALTVGRGSQPDPPSGPPGVVPPPTDLAARHQLPGLLMAASVDVPGGWRVDGSIWGSGGVGFAALSTGQHDSTVSVAVFDLILLSPFDPVTGEIGVLTADARTRWFDRFDRRFDRRVRPRLEGETGVESRFHAWPPLSWIAAHAPARGAIHVSQLVVDGRAGSLLSFRGTGTGTTSALFTSFGQGSVVIRPGVRYSFWAPASDEPLAGEVLIGIASASGADVDVDAWRVIRSLTLRGY